MKVFESTLQGRIFGRKRNEVTGEWRKLKNEGLHNLYSSSDIIMQIKLRRMRWAGVRHAWEGAENCTRFWWESWKEESTRKTKA
jgi:hypothetical protein